MGLFSNLFGGHKEGEPKPGTEAMGSNPGQMAELNQMRDQNAAGPAEQPVAQTEATTPPATGAAPAAESAPPAEPANNQDQAQQ